jgi:putative transposase
LVALMDYVGATLARRPRSDLPDGTYHVAVRGVAESSIFRDDFDRAAFCRLLTQALARFEWRCDAYCLMTTHFHLVIVTSRSSLSKGMHWLSGLYAQRYNNRHGRRGHLFENRFSAYVVRDEEHWQDTCRYVFDNPVKAGLCEKAADWPWSGGLFWAVR